MDLEEYEARLDELGKSLESDYTLIGKLLQRLPIPIGLPPVTPPGGRQGILNSEGLTLAEAVERARIALLDLPMDLSITPPFHTLLVEWLATRELYLRADFGPPEEFVLLALVLASGRMAFLMEFIERQLNPGH
ncbi:hypothetical protein ACWDRB_61150 [Nonomuraea sp. NPDC003707]